MYSRPVHGTSEYPDLPQNHYNGRNGTTGHLSGPVAGATPYGQQSHTQNHAYHQANYQPHSPAESQGRHMQSRHSNFNLPPAVDMDLSQYGPYRGRRAADHRDDFRQYNCDGNPRAPSPDERIPNEIIPTERKNRKTFRRVKPICHVAQGVSYALQMVQQPIRARMCGNGDKDRRPITSPPILKVILRNAVTNEEIDCEASNIFANRFVVVADLYTPDGNREINLLRPRGADNDTSAQVQTPAVYSQPVKPSSVTTQSIPPPQALYGRSVLDNHNRNSLPQPSLTWSAPPIAANDVYPPNASPFDNTLWSGNQRRHTYGAPFSAALNNGELHEPEAMDNNGVVRQMIGNTVASGQLLPDPEGKKGIFFVFNDLSIRQDQWFRVSFSLFYVGELLNVTSEPRGLSTEPNQNEFPTEHSVRIGSNTGQDLEIGDVHQTSPCLAKTWSQPFRVYQAKRFPGVVSSGALSKHFADLGCKIAIRVAKPKKPAGVEGQAADAAPKTKKRRRSGENAADDDEEDKIATMDDLPGDSDEEGEYQVRAP